MTLFDNYYKSIENLKKEVDSLDRGRDIRGIAMREMSRMELFYPLKFRGMEMALLIGTHLPSDVENITPPLEFLKSEISVVEYKRKEKNELFWKKYKLYCRIQNYVLTNYGSTHSAPDKIRNLYTEYITSYEKLTDNDVDRYGRRYTVDTASCGAMSALYTTGNVIKTVKDSRVVRGIGNIWIVSARYVAYNMYKNVTIAVDEVFKSYYDDKRLIKWKNSKDLSDYLVRYQVNAAIRNIYKAYDSDLFGRAIRGIYKRAYDIAINSLVPPKNAIKEEPRNTAPYRGYRVTDRILPKGDDQCRINVQ